MASRRQAAPVPNNAVMNIGLITTILIDCIAAMPWAGGSWANALMTNVEKAKNAPAIKPQPSAAKKVRMKMS